MCSRRLENQLENIPIVQIHVQHPAIQLFLPLVVTMDHNHVKIKH